MQKIQDNYGFLENLFNGAFDKNVFTNININSTPTDRAQKLINNFKEIQKDYPPLELEKSGTLPDKLFEEIKKLGIFGMSIDSNLGGLGFSLSEYLQVVEELSKTDMSLIIIPLAHLSLGIKGIQLFGNEAQKKKYLTQAANGSMIFGYALTEPKKGSDAKSIETTVQLSDDKKNYIINGSKTYITNANYAQGFTVFGQLDQEQPGNMAALIVDADSPGIKIGHDMDKMGLKISSTASIQFKDVMVPVENLLGREGDGFKIAMSILNYGRLGLGAASAGLMEQSAEDMLKRASKRIQFDVPVKNFELIQQKIIRAKVNSALARAMTYYTATVLEKDNLANCVIESSHCKYFGTTKAWDTLYDALQTAGGSGYLKTHPYEKRMRDFRVTTIFEGTTEIHSIYPALMILKNINKKILQLNKNKFKIMILLLKEKNIRAFKCRYKAFLIKPKYLKLLRKHEKLIHKLAVKGLVKYKKKIAEKEFYLKQITDLSLNLFKATALIAHILSDKRNNKNSNVAEKNQILQYIYTEIKNDLQNFKIISRSDLYNEHKKLFEKIDKQY